MIVVITLFVMPRTAHFLMVLYATKYNVCPGVAALHSVRNILAPSVLLSLQLRGMTVGVV